MIDNTDIGGKILLIKANGVLDGKLSDINFRAILKRAYEQGARIVKKSTRIETKEMLTEAITPKGDIEGEIIEMYVDKMKLAGFSTEQQRELIINLMSALKEEKNEGETNTAFEERLKNGVKKIIGM